MRWVLKKICWTNLWYLNRRGCVENPRVALWISSSNRYSFIEKKGLYIAVKMFFFFWGGGGGGVGGGFLEFMFVSWKESMWGGSSNKKIEESLYGTWKIWNHCPNFDAGKTSIKRICNFPKINTHCFRKTPLTNQDQWSLWLSFMSCMIFLRWQEPCVKKTQEHIHGFLAKIADPIGSMGMVHLPTHWP